MLKSQSLGRNVFTRLCSIPDPRRHRPSPPAPTYQSGRTALPSISTSFARFCSSHYHVPNKKSEIAGSRDTKLFHMMPEKANRPDVGEGKGHLEDMSAKQDNDDWKNRPPYRTTDTNEKFHKRHTAHCHCGRVKYWLSRERPLAAKFCHCIDCQALVSTYLNHFLHESARFGEGHWSNQPC